MEDADVRLFRECEGKFGFRIVRAEPVRLGWLNAKWVLHTDGDPLVLKKYHAKRYKDAKVLEAALIGQQRLHEAGIPCPRVLESQGSLLHEAQSGDRYMLLMRFCEGERIESGTASASRMYDLGRVAGAMHLHLNDGSTDGEEPEPQFVPPEPEDRINHWDAAIEQAEREGKPHLVPLFERQKDRVRDLDVGRLRHRCERGRAHRDLWTDNLLFIEDRVSAVLDFDRLNYDYPELDAARAILSGGWNEEGLDIRKVDAFLSGYREFRAFPQGQIADSIALLWYMESVWWLHPGMDGQHPIPRRFANEMMWIASQGDKLPKRLSSL